MKKKTIVFVISTLLVFTILPIAFASAATDGESTTVSIKPQVIWDLNMGPGTQFKVDIVVDYVEKLWAYQIELGEADFNIPGWAPSVLRLVSVENGPFLGSAGGIVKFYEGEIDDTTGTLSLTIGALDPVRRFPTGGGILATLTFEVVGYGQSPIHFDLDTGLLDYSNAWVVRGTINPEALKDGFFANVPDPEMPGPVHDVAITSLRLSSTSAFVGEPIDIDVTVVNQGGFQETFDVLVYADRFDGGLRFDIGSETVSLDVGASDTLFFIWDTTDVHPGSYWVTAEAVLPDDADPDDNIDYVLVGGIYPRPTPRNENIIDLLGSWGPIIVLMVGLGAGPIIIFEILMSIQPRWPWRLSKRRVHNTTK